MRRIAIAILIVWAVSPFLVDLLPVFGDLANIEPMGAVRLVLTVLRFAVWTFLLLVAFRLLKPLLTPLLPFARQYAVTKSARRLQGSLTEVSILLALFLMISVPASVGFVLPEINREIDTRFEARIAAARESPDTRSAFQRLSDGVGEVVGSAVDSVFGVEREETDPLDEGGEAYTELRTETRREVWAEIRPSPLGYFGRVWAWSLGLALVLYLPTRIKSLRYGLAQHYERVLRFVEQGRFGQGGSARFAGLIEEWAVTYDRPTEAPGEPQPLFLGDSLYKRHLSVGLSDKRHMLTIAGARTGKGVSTIIPNLMKWKGSAVITDPKGENAYRTARYRRDVLGQEVHLVDPFGRVAKDEDGRASFNPLQFLDPGSQTYGEDVLVIAEALVVRDPGTKERHWDDGAEMVIAGLIDHLVTSPDHPNPSLPMLRDLMGGTIGTDREEGLLDLWVTMANSTSPAGLARDAALRVRRGYETSEITGILSNVDKHTQWLNLPAMRATLEASASSFDFADLRDRPSSVYLILPSKYLKTHSRFLRLLINTAISRLSEEVDFSQGENGQEGTGQVLMFLDELLALGYMEEVSKAYALLAGYDLILWSFVQDLARLKSLYGEDYNSFISNSRAVQVFGVSDPFTTSFVSDYIGNRRLDTAILNTRASDVKLRPPDELARDVEAEGDRQYVLRHGKAPLLLEKVRYHTDKRFADAKSYEGWKPTGPGT